MRDRLRERLSVEVPDFEAHPEALAELPWACLSAADYWDMRRLNALADAGDFEAITRKVNGGLNFLSCLCGSEPHPLGAGRQQRFLSCLCGSEQDATGNVIASHFSELPMRQ